MLKYITIKCLSYSDYVTVIVVIIYCIIIYCNVYTKWFTITDANYDYCFN